MLVVIVLGWIKLFGGKSNTPQYQTSQVERGTLVASVSESGNISANSHISVTSPTTGVIEEVYVKNGDKVTAGENLFKVKAVATPTQQASAYATYLSALDSAQSATQNKQALTALLEKDRQVVLDAQNSVNSKDANSTNPSTKQGYTDLEKQSIDSALTQAHESFTADETKYKQADTAIAAANAQLASASLSYQATKDSVVTAPIDGTVANLSVAPGNAVTGSSSNSSSSNSSSSNSSNSTSSSSSTGSTVLELGDFSQLSVLSAVNEVDISKIKVGQPVTVTLDAFADKTFVGKVTSVDTVGAASSGVVTFNVYTTLLSPPTSIYAGMTASVIIQTDRRDDVLSVPTTAVQTATDGTTYVRVLKNGKVSQVTVTTGIASDTNTEITSGLSEGDEVVTSVSTTTTTTGSSSTASPFSGLGGNRGFSTFGGSTRTGVTIRAQ